MEVKSVFWNNLETLIEIYENTKNSPMTFGSKMGDYFSMMRICYQLSGVKASEIPYFLNFGTITNRGSANVKIDVQAGYPADIEDGISKGVRLTQTAINEYINLHDGEPQTNGMYISPIWKGCLRNIVYDFDLVIEGTNVLRILGTYGGEVLKNIGDIEYHDPDQFEEYLKDRFTLVFSDYLKSIEDRSDYFTDAIWYSDFFSGMQDEEFPPKKNTNTLLAMINHPLQTLTFFGGSQEQLAEDIDRMVTRCPFPEMVNASEFYVVVQSNLMVFIELLYRTNMVVSYEDFAVTASHIGNPIQIITKTEHPKSEIVDSLQVNVVSAAIENVTWMSGTIKKKKEKAKEITQGNISAEKLQELHAEFQKIPTYTRFDLLSMCPGTTPITYLLKGTYSDFVEMQETLSDPRCIDNPSDFTDLTVQLKQLKDYLYAQFPNP